jgi:hypothetical protein
MGSREVSGFFLLAAAAACGARTGVLSDGNGTGGSAGTSTSTPAAGSVASSSSGAPSCTPLTIDAMASVSCLVADGERVYYVATEGRVMSADAETGATTLLAQIPQQPINVPAALATDADALYVTFIAEDGGTPALWQLPKAGGAPEPIASGWIDNVFVDATGLYWTNFVHLTAQHEVFRRRPDGTTLSLGVVDETYDALPGIFRGTAGLLVPSEAALRAFDVEGAGATTLSDVPNIGFPFERDGALFFNVLSSGNLPYGVFRAAPDGTMAQQLDKGPFERALTDGVRWVFTSPDDGEHAIYGASYPEGAPSLVYHSPTRTSPRAVALTPTRLVLGAAFSELEAGIQSLCRDALGL